MISETIGSTDEWIASLDNLQQLAAFAHDKEFVEKFKAVKTKNKQRLQAWVKEKTGIDIPVNSLYDVQVKRIHEYKRQLLNILYVVHRW